MNQIIYAILYEAETRILTERVVYNPLFIINGFRCQSLHYRDYAHNTISFVLLSENLNVKKIYLITNDNNREMMSCIII
jgi:hypothetical protein